MYFQQTLISLQLLILPSDSVTLIERGEREEQEREREGELVLVLYPSRSISSDPSICRLILFVGLDPRCDLRLSLLPVSSIQLVYS